MDRNFRDQSLPRNKAGSRKNYKSQYPPRRIQGFKIFAATLISDIMDSHKLSFYFVMRTNIFRVNNNS